MAKLLPADGRPKPPKRLMSIRVNAKTFRRITEVAEENGRAAATEAVVLIQRALDRVEDRRRS